MNECIRMNEMNAKKNEGAFVCFLPITGSLMKQAGGTSRQTNALINIFVSETWGKPIMATW